MINSKKYLCMKKIVWFISACIMKLIVRLSPELYLRIVCRRSAIHIWPNLREPKLFAEKMIWLICRWRHPLKVTCADKYAVRKYVSDCGCADLLVPLVGMWECVEAIDFNTLPNKFVLKCTHGCGYNLICRDKNVFNVELAKQKLKCWMGEVYGVDRAEIHYKEIRPLIICEEFLEDGENSMPVDYKFFTFNGKPEFCLVVSDRRSGEYGNVIYRYYDMEWNRIRGMLRAKEQNEGTSEVPRPDGFERMVESIQKLAKPFPFVRVDFYSVGGKPYFGELTFTPAGGLEDKWTNEVQKRLGDLITLPDPI